MYRVLVAIEMLKGVETVCASWEQWKWRRGRDTSVPTDDALI